MLSTSAAFDRAVREGGTISYQAQVQRVSVTTGEIIDSTGDLDVIGSPSINVDVAAAARRSLSSIVIADPDGSLAPVTASHKLAPFGTELVVAAGFVLPGGSVERVPLGVFRLTDSEAAGDGAVVLSGIDRSLVIAENRFEEPYVVAAGTNVVTAITDLAASRYPGLVVSADSSSATVPLSVFQEGDKSGDPWQNMAQLAASAGLEAFIDAAGELRLRPVPDPTTDPPVFTYEPAADALYLSSSLRFESAGVFNVAVVSGEGTDVAAPVRARVAVTDPASPIHPDTFGTRPVFLVTPLVTTQAQADTAAAALLARKAGGAEQLSFVAAPHPAHEGGDIVTVINDDLGVEVNVVLARFSMPVMLDAPVQYSTLGRRVD
jgi:hypothetical protein